MTQRELDAVEWAYKQIEGATPFTRYVNAPAVYEAARHLNTLAGLCDDASHWKVEKEEKWTWLVKV